MAAQIASRVRWAAFRKRCLSLEKTCSMGFRSGEYLGRKNSFTPAALRAWRMTFPLWLPRLSMTTMSPGLQGRQENLLNINLEPLPIDRTLDEPRSIDAIMTQRRQECHGLPAPVGDFRLQP